MKKPKWVGICIIAGNGPTKERRICRECDQKCEVIVGLNDDDPKCRKEAENGNR